METNERIKEILRREGISGLKLCTMLGLKEDAIKSITSGKVKSISQKVADGIVENFPHYNKLWILTGDGEMLVQTNQSSNIRLITTPNDVVVELIRQDIKLMHEEISLVRQSMDMIHEELTLLRQLITKDTPHFTIGIASDDQPTPPSPSSPTPSGTPSDTP